MNILTAGEVDLAPRHSLGTHVRIYFLYGAETWDDPLMNHGARQHRHAKQQTGCGSGIRNEGYERHWCPSGRGYRLEGKSNILLLKEKTLSEHNRGYLTLSR